MAQAKFGKLQFKNPSKDGVSTDAAKKPTDQTSHELWGPLLPFRSSLTILYRLVLEEEIRLSRLLRRSNELEWRGAEGMSRTAESLASQDTHSHDPAVIRPAHTMISAARFYFRNST